MIINIGRQLAAGGREVGRRVAERLGLQYYDCELLSEAAKESGISAALFRNADESHDLFLCALGSRNAEIFKLQSDTIKHLAEQGDCLFIGRCADYVLRERTDCLNIFLTADKAERVARVMETQHLSERQAEDLVDKADRRRADYYNFYTGKTWGAAASYDLCFNTSRLSIDEIVEFICSASRACS